MASILPGGGGRAKGRGHGGNAHYAVNLDTGHHLPTRTSDPVRTTPTEKAHIGPDTLIFAQGMGHPPLPYLDHARGKTNVHKHLTGKAKHAHPAEEMRRHAPAIGAEMAAQMAAQMQGAAGQLPGRAG